MGTDGFGPAQSQDDPTGRQWTWQEGEYTVFRGAARTAPGCHSNCNLLLYVKDGKLDHVEGDPESPYNQGRVCPRCLAIKEMVYHPDRLLYPMKRAREDRGKNCFERISWDEAYDIIDKEFHRIQDEYGTQSIYVMMGTGRDVNGYTNLAAAYLGTECFGLAFQSGNACYIPRSAVCNMKLGCYPRPDYSQFWVDRYANPEWKRPEYILIWGNDPLVSNAAGILGHWVTECMKLGSKLIVVDPRLTWLAGKADVWLPLRPGTDGALALGIANQIIAQGLQDQEFISLWTYGYEQYAEVVAEWTPARTAEVCGVDEDLIIDAARRIGSAENVALQWGVAIDQTRNGYEGICAILDIIALTGNIEKPGTNVADAHGLFGVVGIPSPEVWSNWLGMEAPNSQEIYFSSKGVGKFSKNNNPDDIIDAMETGKPWPVKACWMQGTNPVTCMPPDPKRVQRALENDEFNVVVDLFMTPTIMAAADIVLPTTMFCEKAGLAGQTYATILAAQIKAIEPPGECKPDHQIVYEMGQRFRGKGTQIFETEEEFFDFRLRFTGMTYEDLRNRVYAVDRFEYNKHEKGMMRPDGQPGFNTPTGRYEFWSTLQARAEFDPVAGFKEPRYSPVATPELLEEYPLILATGVRTWGYFHSEHRQSPSMRRMRPNPIVQIHPETAAKYGLENGDWAIVENQFGKARMQVDSLIEMRRDMLIIDSAWWFPERDVDDGTNFGVFESNASTLLIYDVGDSGFCADYKSTLCKIYKEGALA